MSLAMDSPGSGGNVNARFRLDRAEPWQQEAAQRQIDAQRTQREALQQQIAEKQARGGGGNQQRRGPNHNQPPHQHAGPPPGHASQQQGAPPGYAPQHGQNGQHGGGGHGGGQDRGWSQPQGSDMVDEGYGPGPPAHGPPQPQHQDEGCGPGPPARGPPQPQYQDEGYGPSGRGPPQPQHQDEGYGPGPSGRGPPPPQPQYQEERGWGETGSSFGPPHGGPMSNAANSPVNQQGEAAADIDEAGVSEILSMMQELKAQNAEMRTQLDDTIKAKQKMSTQSKKMTGGARRAAAAKPAPEVKPRHGRRARSAADRQGVGGGGGGGDGSNPPANRHRRPVTEQQNRPRPDRVDVQEDVEILLAYYSEYDSSKATEEKVKAIIEKFRAKHGGQWRDEMYSRIGEKRGVNPRDLFRDRRKQLQRNPHGINQLRQSELPPDDHADEGYAPAEQARRPPPLQLPGVPRLAGRGPFNSHGSNADRDKELELDQQARSPGGNRSPAGDGYHGGAPGHSAGGAGAEQRTMDVPGLGGISASVATGPQPRQMPTPRTLAARMGHRQRADGQPDQGRGGGDASAWQQAAGPPPPQQQYDDDQRYYEPEQPPQQQQQQHHHHHQQQQHHHQPPPQSHGHHSQHNQNSQQPHHHQHNQPEYSTQHPGWQQQQQQMQHQPQDQYSHGAPSSRQTPVTEPRPYAMYQDDDDHSPAMTSVISPQDPNSPQMHTRFKISNMQPEEQTEMQRKIDRQAAMRAEWDEQVRRKQQAPSGDPSMGSSDGMQAPHHKIVPPRRW